MAAKQAELNQILSKLTGQKNKKKRGKEKSRLQPQIDNLQMQISYVPTSYQKLVSDKIHEYLTANAATLTWTWSSNHALSGPPTDYEAFFKASIWLTKAIPTDVSATAPVPPATGVEYELEAHFHKKNTAADKIRVYTKEPGQGNQYHEFMYPYIGTGVGRVWKAYNSGKGYNAGKNGAYTVQRNSIGAGYKGAHIGYTDEMYSANMVDFGDVHEFHYQQPLAMDRLVGGNEMAATIVSFELVLGVLLVFVCACTIGLLCLGIGAGVGFVMSKKKKTVREAAKTYEVVPQEAIV